MKTTLSLKKGDKYIKIYRNYDFYFLREMVESEDKINSQGGSFYYYHDLYDYIIKQPLPLFTETWELVQEVKEEKRMGILSWKNDIIVKIWYKQIEVSIGDNSEKINNDFLFTFEGVMDRQKIPVYPEKMKWYKEMQEQFQIISKTKYNDH